MMAGCVSPGALLLLMLLGASYSYPRKQGFDPSSSYSGSYGSDPASAATWDMPSGGFAPAVSGSVAGSKTVSNSAHRQNAPRREPSYSQPSERRQPAASHSSKSFAAPARPGHASGSSQPTSTKAISWAVAPPGLGGTRPNAHRSANKPLGSSNMGPPGSHPGFQAGELSRYENRFEHGNYDSETEEKGFQPASLRVEVSNGRVSTSELQPLRPGRHWGPGFPYDYMFLTGQYPQGTITHSSNSFEQGVDHWQDVHYRRYHYPASPGIQEVKQPNQPVKQSTGSSNYGSGSSNYGSGGASKQN